MTLDVQSSKKRGETLKREDRQKWLMKEGKLLKGGMLDSAVGLQGDNLILAKSGDESAVVFKQHLSNSGKRIGLFHYEDASSAEANFTLNWHASYNVCGEDMNAPSGIIT